LKSIKFITVDAIKDMEINKPVSGEEFSEFLKLMKHNEYSVVEQLKKILPGNP
jgi:hypothetical protein